MHLAQLIASGSRRRGLDPRAVLAVSKYGEGGLAHGAHGDNGTSFGPFMLHMGGALPRQHYADAQRWSESPEGIAYALDRIARVARGKQGRAAIEAIVRLFERPANPAAEIERSWAGYGKIGGGAAFSPAAGPGVPSTAGPAAPDRREQLLAFLQQQHPYGSPLIRLLQQQQQPVAPAAPRQTPVAGNVTAAPRARPPRDLYQLLRQLGVDDAITSGFRPGSRTAHGTVSYHSQKNRYGHSRADDINPSDPQAKALIRYARSHPGFFREFIYSRLPWFIKNGRVLPIGQLNRTDYQNHLDHIHTAH